MRSIPLLRNLFVRNNPGQSWAVILINHPRSKSSLEAIDSQSQLLKLRTPILMPLNADALEPGFLFEMFRHASLQILQSLLN